MPSWSGSGTGRSPSSRSTPPSGSPLAARGTSSGCGLGNRWRRKVLDERAHRTSQLWRATCSSSSATGSRAAGSGRQRLAADRRADLINHPGSRHLPARIAHVLRTAQTRKAHLHRGSMPPRQGPRSTNSPRGGANATRRSRGYGTTRGPSSCSPGLRP